MYTIYSIQDNLFNSEGFLHIIYSIIVHNIIINYLFVIESNYTNKITDFMGNNDFSR